MRASRSRPSTRWPCCVVTVCARSSRSRSRPRRPVPEDPPFIGWPELLPGFTTGYDALQRERLQGGPDALRRRGDPRDAAPLRSAGDGCDHDAIFALSYLRTTEEYRRTIEDPTFFEDTRFVNHEDAVFARYYFDAYDAWHQGRRAEIAAAWAIAFRAAADRAVPASGNLSLGHQRPRPARPAVRARGDRAGQARRLEPQARPRPRQRVPQPRDRAALRRDRAPLRPDDRRHRPARRPSTTSRCSRSSPPGARSRGATPSGW